MGLQVDANGDGKLSWDEFVSFMLEEANYVCDSTSDALVCPAAPLNFQDARRAV